MTLGVGKRATLLAFIRLCLAQAELRDDKATKAAEAALMKAPAEALPEGITKATATTLCREVFRRVKGRVLVAHNREWSKTIAGDRDAWLVRMKEGRRVRKVMVTERKQSTPWHMWPIHSRGCPLRPHCGRERRGLFH